MNPNHIELNLGKSEVTGESFFVSNLIRLCFLSFEWVCVEINMSVPLV